VATDTTTRGNWKGTYGGDGFDIPQDSSTNNPTLPTYASLGVTGADTSTWADPTTDPRAPLKAAPGSTGRAASTWYSASSFRFDLSINDGQAHLLALYALDWDGASYYGGRSERIDVLDADTSAVLDSRTTTPDAIDGGEYLVWNVTGHVIVRVTNLGQTNAVIGGLFLGGGEAAATSSASYLGADTATQGNWKGPTAATASTSPRMPARTTRRCPHTPPSASPAPTRRPGPTRPPTRGRS
jgi:hypothetical protein